MTLESEGITEFQAGNLSDNDQEWHRLVPAEARDALGQTEVQRQSVIFEVFKSERDYVADLEAVLDVRRFYIRHCLPTYTPSGFRHASPKCIAPHNQRTTSPWFYCRGIRQSPTNSVTPPASSCCPFQPATRAAPFRHLCCRHYP